MKNPVKFKIISLLILPYLLLLAFHFSLAAAEAAAASTSYAIINASDCYLYRNGSDGDTLTNRLFLLPQTYFVEVVTGSGELYKVKYKDVEGYADAAKLKTVDYIPVSVYPNDVTLHVEILSPSAYVFSRPDQTSPTVYEMPKNTANVAYYNTCAGSVFLNSDTWYYCKYALGEDSVVKGYLHSSVVKIDSVFPAANDTSARPTEPVTSPDNPDEPNHTPAEIPKDSSKVIRAVVIIAICIPAVFIVYLLFKPSRSGKGYANNPPRSKYGPSDAEQEN